MRNGTAVAVIAAGVLALLGIVLILIPGPTGSFGWFAHQPAGDFGFVGGASLMPAARLWGLTLLAVAAAIGAFVTGWVLGNRRGRSGAVDDDPNDEA